ncbi:DoxX OS=Afipia felis OX=1035 GN=BN961_01193 PE=4 SV=1 [Afipia felis]
MNDDFEPSKRIRTVRVNDPARQERPAGLASIASEVETGETTWTARLVIFLRAMAVIAMAMGLYNWAQITGFLGGQDGAFEVQTMQWQAATVYFAVIQLVAAVGLWLATPWGAVVWLTTIVSLAVVEIMFPSIYGGHFLVVLFAAVLLASYLALAWMAARERPP